MSAAERREAVLRAARIEFGACGYAGTSTEAIARRVGVSQPYLFRLFPSKKALFLATSERCFDCLHERFEAVAEGLTGEEALTAMGKAFNELLDMEGVLQMQLQLWAAAGQDEEIREAAHRRLAEVWRLTRRLSGADDDRIRIFIGTGLLLNVFAALGLPREKERLGEVLLKLAPDTP